MIGYMTIGSNDPSASAEFNDKVFGALGGARAYSLDHMIVYGFGSNRTMIMVTKPHDKGVATAGNGAMVALTADDQSQVDAVHALALELGGTDEGAPGPRGKGFYGAYFRDLDQNKFCVYVTV